METLKDLITQQSELIEKCNAALTAVSGIDIDVNLKGILTNAVYDHYLPTLRLIDWKIGFLAEREEERLKAKGF